jgi:hypothetical protein
MAKSVIRRLGVLSVAKLQGTLYALLGLMIGAVFALFALFGAALGSSLGSDHQGSIFGAALGVGAIVFFPVVYGLLGFVGGLLVAALYNLVAGITGGVEIELS